MRHSIETFLKVFALGLFLYLIGAFIAWEANPSYWNVDERVTLAMFYGLFGAVIAVLEYSKSRFN